MHVSTVPFRAERLVAPEQAVWIASALDVSACALTWKSTSIESRQEALNNVHKHARAAKVDVVLQRRADDVVLSIEDDGVGLNLSSPKEGNRGLGFVSMQERAALLGGVLDVEPAVSGGTTIIARVPAFGAAASAGARSSA